MDAEQLIADLRHLDQTGEVAWEEATKQMLDKRLKELEDSNSFNCHTQRGDEGQTLEQPRKLSEIKWRQPLITTLMSS